MWFNLQIVVNCIQFFQLRPQTCQDAKTLWNFKASAILTSDKVHHRLASEDVLVNKWTMLVTRRSYKEEPGQYTDGSTICYYESNIQ